MAFLPYGKQWIDAADHEAVRSVLDSDWLTQGPAVARFEDKLAKAVGADHAVAVSSGTAALHLLYAAAGISAGDTVATSPVTFLATANAAVYCGARPVFADIDPATSCLSPRALRAALEAGLRPKVVVPVHFAGLPCDLASLAELAAEYGFLLLEDACHALGARYRFQGTWGPVGDCRVSRATVFSFHPVKHITTGEGGAVVTNDPSLADAVRRLRSHGVSRGAGESRLLQGAGGIERPWAYEMRELGFNYRITDLQCALGASQLERLSSFVERRRELASRYHLALEPLERSGRLRRPRETVDGQSSWHLYCVRIPRGRDEVYLELRQREIGTQVHYIPLHLQPYYREHFPAPAGRLPGAERHFEEALSLPLFPAMEDRDVDRVAAALAEVLEEAP